MTIEEIKELINVVKDSGIAELEVQRGENRVRIRGVVGQNQEVSLSGVLPVPVAVPSGTAALPAGTHSLSVPAAPQAEDEHNLVKSPIVGTYYDSSAPGSPPFVKIGDRVEPHQVLCIIESMKLMNEIEAETAGIVTAKYIENGRPVEYGEALFAIRPL